MKIEEGALVYCMLNNVPTQCKVHYIGFGGDDIHLLTSLPDNQAFIANTIDLAETAEDCEKEYNERMYAEYHLHYDFLNSQERVMLHLLESSVNGRQIEGNELKAVKDRIAEFTQIDIDGYITEINKSAKKDEVLVNEN